MAWLAEPLSRKPLQEVLTVTLGIQGVSDRISNDIEGQNKHNEGNPWNEE
ncbi:MAG: hypothetical protein RIS46_1172, partial [Actinomycetota bacterium]